MARIKRIVSLYALPDYPEFALIYDDSLPIWQINSVVNIQRRRLCAYCGKPMPPNKKLLCSDFCKLYYRWASHDQKINSLRRVLHYHFKFQCRLCGVHFSYFTPAGVELAIFGGEIDHVVPLKNGGKDLISNMQLICEPCHEKKTEKQYDRK